MSMAEDIAAHQRRKAHYEWRRKVREELPTFAARLYRLRGKVMHLGELELSLGSIIRFSNNATDHRIKDLSDCLVEEVIYEEFVKDLDKAEASCPRPPPPDTTGVELFVFTPDGWASILKLRDDQALRHEEQGWPDNTPEEDALYGLIREVEALRQEVARLRAEGKK